MTSASPHVEMNASAEQCERAQHSLLNSFGPDLPQARQKYECQAAGVATLGSLLPDRRPQSAPDPLLKADQHRRRLTLPAIADPALQIPGQFFGHPFLG